MLYAWVDDEKRAPRTKGERTACRDCGGLLSAVMPVENVRTGGTRLETAIPGASPKDRGISVGRSGSTFRAARSA